MPERRLDAAADERLSRVPASLPASAWDADRVPEAYLPHLAWALSVDEWDPAWSVPAKRAAIRGAVAAHRLKGTAAGVKGMLDRLGALYDYTERPAGDPFTVKITVRNQGSLRISDATSVAQLIERHKRASVTVDLALLSELEGEISLAAGLGGAVLAELPLLDARPALRLEGEISLAAGLEGALVAHLTLDARV